MSAPIIDLHPDDTAARDEIAQSLIQIRHAAKISGKELAAQLGVTQPAIPRMEHSRAWAVATVQRWARAVGHQLAITLDGLHIPDDGDDLAAVYAAMRPQTADAEDRLHLRTVVNDLARARRHLEIPQSALSFRLGLSESAIGWAENAPDGWRVAAVQRYARALGGVAVFELAPVEVGQVAA
jgi:transcriptional regulator with XRE-family HTH domain